MRLTVDEGSTDHWQLVMGDKDFAIRVDGIGGSGNYYTAIDTDEGWAIRLVRENGKFAIDPHNKDEILVEKVWGRVEVVPNGKDVIEHGYTDNHFYLNGVRLSWKTYAYLISPAASMIRARGATRRLSTLA